MRRRSALLALGFSLVTFSPALAAATAATSSQGVSSAGSSVKGNPSSGVSDGVSAATRTATLRQARLLIASFYAVKVDALWKSFTPDMQRAWMSLSDFTAYRQMGVKNFGDESRLLGEQVVSQDGLTVYIRTSVFIKQPQQVWQVLVGFDAAGKVALFNIVPAGDLPDAPTTQG